MKLIRRPCKKYLRAMNKVKFNEVRFEVKILLKLQITIQCCLVTGIILLEPTNYESRLFF
jgi:hypothetical protein